MRLRGVGRRYGLRGPWVLRGVDLDVPRGALLRVEGGNGSGKSTLLRLVARIDAPSAGRITGRPRTAYVPERFPAELPFTALGYLTHLGRVHGLRRPVAARRAVHWLDRFGAGGHARSPLAELSKGTSQKVAVAQALLAEPELLVLDEAWTGLDRDARRVLDEAVLERVAGGGTVVFVDHDPRRLAGARHTLHRVSGGGVALVPGPAGPPGPGPDPRSGPAGPDSRSGLAGPEPGARPAGPGAADPDAGSAAAARTVLIEAEGPPGAELPPGLSAAPAGPGGARGGPPGAGPAVRLTVSAASSDAVLRALLGARPPWHILGVAPLPEGSGDRPGPAAPGATAPAPTTRPGEA